MTSILDTLLLLSRSLAGARQGGMLADTLDLLLDGALGARGAAYAVVGDALELVGERGLPAGLRAGIARLPLKGPPWFTAQKAAHSRKLVADRDLGAAEASALDRAAVARAGWGQVVACPIVAVREVFGVLVLAWPVHEEPDPSALAVLEIACNMMAVQMARRSDEQRRGEGQRADARAAWLATLGVLAAGFAEGLGAELGVVAERLTEQQRRIDGLRARLVSPEGGARSAARAADLTEAVQAARERTARFLSATQPGVPERLDLGELAREALALAAPRLRRRRVDVHLRAEGPHVVVGRRGELLQLLSHLVFQMTGVLDDADDLRSNRSALIPQTFALEIARHDGQIVVRLGDAAEDGSGARASFFDAAAQMGEPGFDFGVVREIVIAHEGHIEIGAGGASYSVVLPAAGDETDRRAARSLAATHVWRQAPDKARPVLLWIDEDELLLEIMVQSLADLDVRVARSATEAMQLLAFGLAPALICCNVRLPDRLGHVLHDEIARQSPILADRFVFVTDGVLTPDLVSHLVASGRPTLTRPILVDQVRTLVLREPAVAARAAAAAPTLMDMRAGARDTVPAPARAPSEPPPTPVTHGTIPGAPVSTRGRHPSPPKISVPVVVAGAAPAGRPVAAPRAAESARPSPMRDQELAAIASVTADFIRRDGPTRSASVVGMLRDRGMSEVEAAAVVTYALSKGLLVRDPAPSTMLRVLDAGSRGRVLVVDDDFDLRLTLHEILADEGYAVDTAANGREALDQLRKSNPPHVVVLDLMMPVMDGWELLDELKRDEALSSVPVVVISAGKAGLRARHAREVLPKPLDYRKLIASVDRSIKARPAVQ